MLLNFHSNKLFFAEIFTGLSILSELRDIAGGQWMFQMFQTMLENYTKHSCDCYFEKFTKSERRIATTLESSFAISPPLAFQSRPRARCRKLRSQTRKQGHAERDGAAAGPRDAEPVPLADGIHLKKLNNKLNRSH